MSALKHIPNLLTIVRILLVIPFVGALLSESYQLALLLLFIAGATDGLDGFLARHYGWFSWFGSVADPVADKTLLVASFVVFGMMGHLPWWLIYVVVGRDILIFGGALLYWRIVGSFEGRPTILGKLCTFYLIAHGIMVLVNLALFTVPHAVIAYSNWLVAGLCIVSGVHYVYLGVKGLLQWKSETDD